MAMSELRDAYFSFFTDGCIPSDKPVCIPEAVAREYEEHFRVAIGREWPFLIEQYRCRVLLFTEEGDVSSSSGEGGDGAAVQDSRPCFYSRMAWLKKCLLERGWSTSDPYTHGGPDRKTVEKVLRGERVRNDMLEKLAAALSQKCSQVSVLDIPQR
jgi:hypothetical protein